MIGRSDEVSPQRYARAGGVLYLIIFVMAGVAFGLQSKFVVSGDPGATASNIVASAAQWRLSVAAELLMFSCDVALAVIFFVLLRPVNAGLALVAAFFRLAEAVIGSINAIWHVVPLLLLTGSPAYLKAFQPQALQTWAYLSLRIYDNGQAISLIPFGVTCILLGYLIFQSTYLPKTLGVLLTIAGVCYLVNSFTLILAPNFSTVTFIAVFVSALPAEVGLALWLLIKGVNLPRWRSTVDAVRDSTARRF